MWFSSWYHCKAPVGRGGGAINPQIVQKIVTILFKIFLGKFVTILEKLVHIFGKLANIIILIL